MWTKRHHSLATILLFWGGSLVAHPVAYKGAWSFMAFNQPDMQDWQLLYSVARKFSLGVNYIHDTMEGADRYFLIPRVSWLVNRWNGKDYQANIYVYGGIGIAKKNALNEVAGEAAIEADYETRKVYFSGKASAVVAKGFDTLAIYQLRAGFAPYEGGYDEIQAWLIAQAQYLPFAKSEPVRVGPVVRIFYRNVLTEMGVSAQGTWNFNFMVHF